MSSFLKNIQNTAHHFDLWKKHDRILIAVSGGPDSLCLLDCLVHLGKKYDWTLHIAHVNYRLRGQDSNDDEILVQERAKFYRLPFSVLRPKQTKETGNLEARLRMLRYEFFEKLRKKHRFDSIAIAHNRDDQAETVLLRLLRGSGLRGLGAMRPKDNRLIRPLLLTPRADILSYLKEKNLPCRLDTSNTNLRFMRNRVRHELLPLLETFNPNIRETLALAALSLADDADALGFLFEQNSSLLVKKEKTDFSFSAKATNALHPAAERAFLRSLAEESVHYKQPPSFNEIEEMRKIIASAKNKKAEKTFRGLKFTRRGDRVSVLIR